MDDLRTEDGGALRAELAPGEVVRLRSDPGRLGPVLELIERQGRAWVVVQFPDGPSRVPLDVVERMPTIPEGPVTLLRRGRLEGPDRLRRRLAHIRLSGRLADVLYSLESTDTEFYAHQFKPVLKLLASPTGHLLIADEVGLGKTIEAGLIWTELVARFQHRRLVVVCPKVLCDKWKRELERKFDLAPQILSPEGLAEALDSPALQRRGFVAICGMQAIRPRPAAERTGRSGADRLADLCEGTEAYDDRIDLFVVDEAHHMRNPGTQTHALGAMLARLANHVVMLSATPINLRNRDLHSLLRLVDPDTFRDERALEDIVDANAPLIAARDAVLRGAPAAEVARMLAVAESHPLLAGTRALPRLREEVLALAGDLRPERRAGLAARLEGVNLLANVVNRTRRRDVDEFRVTRNVNAVAARMTPLERDAYDRATEAVLDFAAARGLPVGFLTVTPQRMLASCLPAALGHWRQAGGLDGFEDEEDDGDLPEEGPGALRRELGRLAATLADPGGLERQDSKFAIFLDALRTHLALRPGDKVVVFSTFRPTLAYLRRRLSAEGIPAEVMDGLVQGRTELVERFRVDPALPVLLSSEVGSEGIDLQFAATVFNYDLPWNPMRVEQRIGRVDRLGQEAETITVLNFLHADTVDERIWTRLYERLELCRTALGDFEEILGEQIAGITRDLLSGRLSPAEQDDRLRLAEQAIATRRAQEDDLEREAASLIAHGDHVLREIRDRRDDQRMISEDDILAYLRLGLNLLHPGCDLSYAAPADRLELRLTADARAGIEKWGRARSVDPGQLGRSGGALTFRLRRASAANRHPRMGQSHPLIRYLSDRLGADQETAAPAVALACSAADVPGLVPGIYVGAVQEWRFGRSGQIQLVQALAPLRPGGELDPGEAERALRRGVSAGRVWAEVRERVDCEEAAERAGALLAALHDRFEDAWDRETAETEDRIAIQVATLERGAAEDRARLERTIERAGPRLEAANRARLDRLDDRVRLRRAALEERRGGAPQSRDVAVVLLLVEEDVG